MANEPLNDDNPEGGPDAPPHSNEGSLARRGRHDPVGLMLYDGECGFCTDTAYRLQRRIGPQLQIAPLQDEQSRPAGLPVEQLEKQLHMIEIDGTVYRGAAAVFRAMAYRPRYALLWWLYRYVPGVRPLTEWLYRLVADNRPLVSRLTRWLRR